MKLHEHPTIGCLEKLIPDVIVEGGSFAESLPPPAEIPSDKRLTLLEEGRRNAIQRTIAELLQSAGLDPEIPVTKESKGNRVWPEGYAGSLTHKGAVVLGALGEKSSFRSLGIDLELDKNGDEMIDYVLEEGEVPPNVDAGVSALAGFSVKESVYKAFYPLHERDITFSDVRLEWIAEKGDVDRGVAYCPKGVQLKICCGSVGDWIISTAILKPQPNP